MDWANRLGAIEAQLNQKIIGQSALVRSLLISLLADGHLLVEGAPGLAKTTAIKALSEVLDGDFARLQFTPDLLPADLTGTDVFRPDIGQFSFQRGPLFHELLLADEINRAPAKVQSALLEAMAERQITVGQTTYPLPPVFLVMATQNPIEQEGTFALPEAQLDRFLLHVNVDYPAAEHELEILQLNRRQARDHTGGDPDAAPTPLQVDEVLAARDATLDLHMSDSVERYLVALVLATRNPSRVDATLGERLAYGASPRATIGLDRAARANALLAGRDYVSPSDVQAVAPNVLRHRLILTFEAEAAGVTADQIVNRLLAAVPAP